LNFGVVSIEIHLIIDVKLDKMRVGHYLSDTYRDLLLTYIQIAVFTIKKFLVNSY